MCNMQDKETLLNVVRGRVGPVFLHVIQYT